jgi:hypothetical protein
VPRRRAIPQSIETKFFSNVTPLWVPPGQPPIPERYRDGVFALAEWAGPGWPDGDRTDFFLIRSVIINSCESWKFHDWQGDEASIRERRKEAKSLPELHKAVSILAKKFSEEKFHLQKKMLANIFLFDFNIEPQRNITNSEAFSAIEKVFNQFAEHLEINDQWSASYGPVEYDILPKKLPRREVAIALCLADRITFFRKDGYSKGSLCTPHKPNLSPNLPWKAIASFASANLDDAEGALDPCNVQTLVTNLMARVASVSWNSPKRSIS